MREISLTQGYVALVDCEDFERLSLFKWYAFVNASSGIVYAARGKRTFMHNEILRRKPNEQHVDHINGNGLDNTKQNLRVVSVSENALNSHRHRSGNVGVDFVPSRGTWRARGLPPQRKHLGYFSTKEAAKAAYNNSL